MLKRIFTIALFTGAAQVFVIFALKYISKTSSPEQVKAIGQIDSLVLFITNVIALGLQPTAMRNLALTENWKQEYLNTQSARFTLSIFIAAFALLAFIDSFYLAFLIAPLLALSGDYALYGRGVPVKGAVIAFIRTVIPFILILFFINKTWQLSWLYFGGLLLAYVINNVFISVSLKAFHWPQISIASLKMYLSTLPLGFVSLGLYFIGIGVILIAQYFYSAPTLAIAFVGLKFYVIFKGILRIIQQAFLKEMIKDEVCLKVDQLSSLIGFTFLCFVISFPNTFISLFFGSKYLSEKSYFILIAFSAFIYSLFSSFTTRAMLDKKDKQYAITTTCAALLTLSVCVALSFFIAGSVSIGISILVGETAFAVGMLRLMNRKQLLIERMVFIARNIPFLIIPFAAVFIFGEREIIFFPTLFVLSVSLYLFHRNKFHFTDAASG